MVKLDLTDVKQKLQKKWATNKKMDNMEVT